MRGGVIWWILLQDLGTNQDLRLGIDITQDSELMMHGFLALTFWGDLTASPHLRQALRLGFSASRFWPWPLGIALFVSVVFRRSSRAGILASGCWRWTFRVNLLASTGVDRLAWTSQHRIFGVGLLVPTSWSRPLGVAPLASASGCLPLGVCLSVSISWR